jgi:hypothetical protein
LFTFGKRETFINVNLSRERIWFLYEPKNKVSTVLSVLWDKVLTAWGPVCIFYLNDKACQNYRTR